MKNRVAHFSLAKEPDAILGHVEFTLFSPEVGWVHSFAQPLACCPHHKISFGWTFSGLICAFVQSFIRRKSLLQLGRVEKSTIWWLSILWSDSKGVPSHNFYLFLIEYFLLNYVHWAGNCKMSLITSWCFENACLFFKLALYLCPGLHFIVNLNPLERETSLHRSCYVQQLHI